MRIARDTGGRELASVRRRRVRPCRDPESVHGACSPSTCRADGTRLPTRTAFPRAGGPRRAPIRSARNDAAAIATAPTGTRRYIRYIGSRRVLAEDFILFIVAGGTLNRIYCVDCTSDFA